MMPLGVPFRDKNARRGFSKPVDSISISQHNRQKIRFKLEKNKFILELPVGIERVSITNRNAIRLAHWILESTANATQGTQDKMAKQGKADRKSS